MKASLERIRSEKDAIDSMFRLFDAQAKEESKDMVKFDGFIGDPHSIKIIDDSYGFLTCTVRERKGGKLLHTVRFRKRPKCGVIYNFMDACRLNRLWIDRDLFESLLVGEVSA